MPIASQSDVAAEPANRRTAQRERTRQKIVLAAAKCFAERGFGGATTRDIANRAGTNQGLITYHFASKDALWRAAADEVFGAARVALFAADSTDSTASTAEGDSRERAREQIRRFARYAAAHPELFRFLVEEGKTRSPRMEWLVDTHLGPLFSGFQRLGAQFGKPDAPIATEMIPHAFYVMAGASSLIFAVVPECERLTGLDPLTPAGIERHADFVARLLVSD